MEETRHPSLPVQLPLLTDSAPTPTSSVDVPLDRAFPTRLAERLAQAESYNKHLYRPNTYLHKWWARRCGTTFRAILKQLVPDPARRDFYASGGLEGVIVLDPMMGGGTTLHEAIRMGANVIGADIDPIPVVQVRAALSPIALGALRETFADLTEHLSVTLGPLYETTTPKGDTVPAQFVLYGAKKRCACREVIMVDSHVLRHEANRVILLHGDGHVTAAPPESREVIEGRIVAKQTTCPRCGERFTDVLEQPYRERFEMVAIAGRDPASGRFFFKTPDAADRERARQPQHLAEAWLAEVKEATRIAPGPKSSDLLARGITHYADLFSLRQLAYLAVSTRWLAEVPAPVKTILGLLVSTSLEFNSLLCGYKGAGIRRPGAIRHTFQLHAYSFPYTCAENNPVYPKPASGSLRRLFQDRVVRAKRWAQHPQERLLTPDGRTRKTIIDGEVDAGTEVKHYKALQTGMRRYLLLQGDSRTLPLPDQSVDYVVTDPPYYDSVQYSDLADFFRVWLRHLLPDDADWGYDTAASVAVTGDESDEAFSSALGGILRESARALRRPHGRVVFTYHHWRPEAWAHLTLALRHADLALVSYYVITSENPASVHTQNLHALTHDCILVLAPRELGISVREWPLPESINTGESFAFCRDCGETLGWLLTQPDQPTETILDTWRRLIAPGGRAVSDHALIWN
jgi:putative DNA methylase